jgi:hypothetical protein
MNQSVPPPPSAVPSNNKRILGENSKFEEQSKKTKTDFSNW